jgi:acyl-CoA thioesterase
VLWLSLLCTYKPLALQLAERSCRTFTNRFFDDAGPVSTLDLSVRFFTPDLDFNQFHLQEQRTMAAGVGRTFNTGQLWSEDGKLVAHMSQQCICRPPEEKKAKL